MENAMRYLLAAALIAVSSTAFAGGLAGKWTEAAEDHCSGVGINGPVLVQDPVAGDLWFAEFHCEFLSSSVSGNVTTYKAVCGYGPDTKPQNVSFRRDGKFVFLSVDGEAEMKLRRCPN